LDKGIDTALLPLKVKGKRLSDNFPAPKIAGGITTIGDAVIVLDRLGNIYSYRPDRENVAKLTFPALPNNINNYSLSGAHVDTNTFRAYNIKYLERAKLLAVSHEYFDNQYNKTRLAVSVIGFDADLMRPIGAWRTIFLSDVESAGSNTESGAKLASDGSDKLYLTIGDYGEHVPASPKIQTLPLEKSLKLASALRRLEYSAWP